MKTSKSHLLLFAVVAAFFQITTVAARADVSFEFFSENLDPYGEWIETSNYGYCWRPTGVDEDWAPYTDGYWAYTDGGWTWVSYEDFGGITYHYGRWTRLVGIGWCWVPDYEWAPAWVSWRSSDDYIGWAPLPPECRFNRGIGISFWVDTTYGIGPYSYNFCSYRDFGSPALRPVIINRSRNVTIINYTTNITNISVNHARNIIYNGGPVFATMASRTQRPIQTLSLAQQTDVNAIRASGRRTMARQQGNQLIVAAPQISPPTERVRPQKVARTFQKVDVDGGWNKVRDPHVRQQLEAKMKHDAKGLAPEQAPAKAVTAGELNAFSERLKATPQSAVAGTGQHESDRKRAGGRPVAPPVISGQPTTAPVEQTITTTPDANQRPSTGRKERPAITPPAPVQAVATPAEQTITPVPTPRHRDAKNRDAKSGGQTLPAQPEAKAASVTPSKPDEMKPAPIPQIAQPSPTVDPGALDKDRQIQAEQLKAAREREAQIQQQQQAQAEQQRTAKEREAQIQQQRAAAMQQRELQQQQQAQAEQQRAAKEREAQSQQQRAAAMQQRELQQQQQAQAEQQRAAKERQAQIQQQRAAAMQQRELQQQQQAQGEQQRAAHERQAQIEQQRAAAMQQRELQQQRQAQGEQQRAAHERQAQIEQQRAAAMQQRQVRQPNPQPVQQAPENEKGRKHDKKDEEQH